MESHPGSVVLIAVEQPEVCNFARCTAAWLSREERKTLKTALEKARKKRALLRQDARGDLGSVSEPNDSKSLEETGTPRLHEAKGRQGAGVRNLLGHATSGSVARTLDESL